MLDMRDHFPFQVRYPVPATEFNDDDSSLQLTSTYKAASGQNHAQQNLSPREIGSLHFLTRSEWYHNIFRGEQATNRDSKGVGGVG